MVDIPIRNTLKRKDSTLNERKHCILTWLIDTPNAAENSDNIVVPPVVVRTSAIKFEIENTPSTTTTT